MNYAIVYEELFEGVTWLDQIQYEASETDARNSCQNLLDQTEYRNIRIIQYVEVEKCAKK